MPGKVTPVVGYQMPGSAITFPVVRTGTATPEISQGGGETSADWLARSTAAGVFRAFDFSTRGSLVTSSDAIVPGRFGYTPGSGPNATTPTIETNAAINTVVASSIRFDIPGLSYDNAGGSWQCQFSADGSITMGANSHFFIQWRQRFNQAFIDTIVLAAGGGYQAGIKQSIIDSDLSPNSHSQTHLVPTSYNQCRFTDIEIGEANYVTRINTGSDYDLQPGKDGGATCWRSVAIANFPPTQIPGCVNWYANEWMTFQLEVLLGPIISKEVFNQGGSLGVMWCFANSELRLWQAREGQASVKVIDWNPSTQGYSEIQCDPDYPRFGRIYLLPYMTAKDMTQNHATMSTWYSELILSTQKIADPSVTTYPAWRLGKTKDTIYSISGTQSMSNISLPLPSNESPPFNGIIDAWSSFTSDGPIIYSSLGGGHQTGAPDAEWQNAVLQIDLSQNAPAWSVVDPGSAYADAWVTQHYRDGRPCSRHTYYDVNLIKGAHTYDGKDRIFHPECFAAWAEGAVAGWPGFGIDPNYGSGPQVEAFRLVDAASGAEAWDAINYWNQFPGFYGGDPPANAHDARSGLIYLARGHQCWIFDVSMAHGTWTTLSPAGMDNWGMSASTIDTNNNRLVGLLPSRQASNQTPRLQRMLLTSPYTISDVALQNFTPQFAQWEFDQAAMVYDPDNDRFLIVRPNNDGNIAVDRPLLAIAQDGTCTELTNAVVPRARSQSVPLKRLVYIPTLKCVVYASRFTNQLHFIPTVTG